MVNRAQADINSNVTMDECRKREMEFFNGSPHYRGLRNVGMGSLTHKLCRKLESDVSSKICPRFLPLVMAMDTSCIISH